MNEDLPALGLSVPSQPRSRADTQHVQGCVTAFGWVIADCFLPGLRRARAQRRVGLSAGESLLRCKQICLFALPTPSLGSNSHESQTSL